MYITVRDARVRLEGCDIGDNGIGGVLVTNEGDPTLVGCTLRGHPERGNKPSSGSGVYVHSSARGRATVGADCVFANNAGANVVRL